MKLISKILTIVIFIGLLIGLIVFYLIPIFQNKSLGFIFQKSLIQTTNPISTSVSTPTLTPSPTPTEIIKTISTPTFKPTSKPVITPTSIVKYIDSDTAPWGVAQQISEHTWTMKVGQDSVMASATEILEALNNYRSLHGSQKLTMDSRLTEYAQTRANYFYQKEGLDSHQGFNNFLTNEDGFSKLGFSWLGENASFGYRLNGVHLIEWIYASDQDHNQNQLNNNWNYVGIGVKDTATCLIFATGKS